MVDPTKTAEKLFEVTREQLETGLRGYPVGYCITSTVDPYRGLFYANHPVSDITSWSSEEVIYLLYNGLSGSKEKVASFSAELKKRAVLSQEVISYIRLLPRKEPMHLFATALLIVGMLEGTGDYREDALNIVAKVPAIAAIVINHHAGWERQDVQKPELGYIENFTHLLNPPLSSSQHGNLNEFFKLFNILHYDHGGGNLSAFTGKAIASGLQEIYACLGGAMCALGGPRHGRANRDCLEQLESLLCTIGHEASEEKLEETLKEQLQSGQLLFGFGHAVLRVEDPRATVFYNITQERYPEHPLVKMALRLRHAGTRVLASMGKVADPYPNVDAISGTALAAAGFNYPNYFSVLFGMARCVGISRQIVYERCEARDGKGVPIYRPKFLFKPHVDSPGK